MTGERGAAVAARLRRAGLRATRPRLAVIEALRAMGGHHTADEVHGHLVEHGVTMPRTSVYNSLSALAGLGVVLRADVGPGAAVYEVADAWHHHFVCRRCGAVRDVPCVLGDQPCLAPGDDLGRVEQAQVIFRGVCRTCLARDDPAEDSGEDSAEGQATNAPRGAPGSEPDARGRRWAW
jgi:Fur family ferric uptake transcriptional regulator